MSAATRLWTVKLENHFSENRQIKLFSYVEFCLWNALDDITNFQRNLNIGEVEVDGSTIYHTTEYRERRNHYAFYHVNQSLAGFDTQRDEFVGPYKGLNEPAAVVDGKPRDSVASGWSPIASHCLEIELQPGEKKELIFVLGYIENPDEEKWESPGVVNKQRAQELIQAFETPVQVQLVLEELKDYWSRLLSNYHVDTEDDRLDRMVSIWNAYQCCESSDQAPGLYIDGHLQETDLVPYAQPGHTVKVECIIPAVVKQPVVSSRRIVKSR